MPVHFLKLLCSKGKKKKQKSSSTSASTEKKRPGLVDPANPGHLKMN